MLRSLPALVAALVVALAGCSSGATAAGGPAAGEAVAGPTPPERTALATPTGPLPAPAPDAPGRYRVGRRTFAVHDPARGNRARVVAPDHTGNTAPDAALGRSATRPDTVRDRPLDVSFLISSVFAGAGGLAGSVDTARVGVTGHSLGGYTALATVTGTADTPPDPGVKAIVALAPVSTILPAGHPAYAAYVTAVPGAEVSVRQ